MKPDAYIRAAEALVALPMGDDLRDLTEEEIERFLSLDDDALDAAVEIMLSGASA